MHLAILNTQINLPHLQRTAIGAPVVFDLIDPPPIPIENALVYHKLFAKENLIESPQNHQHNVLVAFLPALPDTHVRLLPPPITAMLAQKVTLARILVIRKKTAINAYQAGNSIESAQTHNDYVSRTLLLAVLVTLVRIPIMRIKTAIFAQRTIDLIDPPEKPEENVF